MTKQKIWYNGNVNDRRVEQFETLDYILHLNDLVALFKPTCGLEIAHSHHDWIEINIRRLGGATYYASAKVEYVQNLENTLTPLELINTLLKMGKQGGTYYEG